MRIEVKGRNVEVDDELRARVEKRFDKIARQVSDLAR
ncbi:MAG: ribosomal subunit interface protein, partial [Actinobacteria bacterium]